MIPFPDISPEIFSITVAGREFALRWYALAYLVGLLAGWRIMVALMRRPALWGDRAPMAAERDQVNTRRACMVTISRNSLERLEGAPPGHWDPPGEGGGSPVGAARSFLPAVPTPRNLPAGVRASRRAGKGGGA